MADTLGYVYLRKGLHGPAVEQFRHAVASAQRSGRDQPVFHYHLGLALREMGRSQEAAQAFQSALALDGDFEDARQALDGLDGSDAEPTTDPT